MTTAGPGVASATEKELIVGVIGGDEAAFRPLYDAHTPALYRLALRLTGGHDADAQDLVQETWVRAVRGLGRFAGRSALRTWLSAITARCAAEQYRRGRRETDGLDEEGVVDGGSDPVRRVALERALASLPFGFRSVLILHDVEGFRHREIAEMLGISDGTSKSQLARARRRMRELLGDD